MTAALLIPPHGTPIAVSRAFVRYSFNVIVLVAGRLNGRLVSVYCLFRTRSSPRGSLELVRAPLIRIGHRCRYEFGTVAENPY